MNLLQPLVLFCFPIHFAMQYCRNLLYFSHIQLAITVKEIKCSQYYIITVLWKKTNAPSITLLQYCGYALVNMKWRWYFVLLYFTVFSCKITTSFNTRFYKHDNTMCVSINGEIPNLFHCDSLNFVHTKQLYLKETYQEYLQV